MQIYSYDAVGNITKVLSGSTTFAEYTYDGRGQLLSEDDGKYYTTYTYDTYGNIRSAWVRASEDHNFVYGVYNYTYNDNGLWKDQLKGYNYQNYTSPWTVRSSVRPMEIPRWIISMTTKESHINCRFLRETALIPGIMY